MEQTEGSNWFELWFNSPYYHILYKNRDFEEAEMFIDNLLEWLKPEPGGKILDLACGKGRHSLYLCKKGFDVTGVDLSPKSIEAAKRLTCHHLSFEVHDMRKVIREQYFDHIFNFFTSFGYFEDEKDNYATTKAMAAELKPGGCCVIDFMNVSRVLQHLKEEEIVESEGIEFHITRIFDQGYIVKNISFTHQGKEHHYYERVQALELSEFEKYLSVAGFTIKETFGNYRLEKFDPDSSDRLIVVAQLPQ